MRWRLMAIVASLVAAGALGAVVFAQLSDTQTSSGTVNVTSTSADLYICEPDSTPGPDCGSDDSGADETVFETLEDIKPGDEVTWDLRLKNEGTENWMVSAVTLDIVETVDLGADCPDGGLQGPIGSFGVPDHVRILGKNGDEVNDNPLSAAGFPRFFRQSSPDPYSTRTIKVAAGDYEDVRLRLQLQGVGTENCDGNEWNVSWQFTVLPVSP